MSVSGEYFGTEEFFSPARFNRKVPSHLTGAQMAALSPTYANQIIICTSSGSGFTADTLYMRNSANTAWIGGGGGMHKHDANTDAAGGLLSDVFYANAAKIIYLADGVAPSTGMFKQETSGGATISDVHPEVRLFCGTANGAYAHATRSGVGINWASNIRFIARLRVSHGTYVTSRFGVNSESANDTPAADGGGINRMGLEACDSAGTTRNYDVFTGNGTTRSAATTTSAVAQASPHAYRLDFTTAVNVIASFDNTVLATKTSAIPSGGSSTNTRLVSAGVRQNNSFTAGNERTMFLSGLLMSGVPATTAWI